MLNGKWSDPSVVNFFFVSCARLEKRAAVYSFSFSIYLVTLQFYHSHVRHGCIPCIKLVACPVSFFLLMPTECFLKVYAKQGYIFVNLILSMFALILTGYY